MTDVLIRNVPDDDLQGIDDAAQRLGLSRTEFLRREMHQVARGRLLRPATADDLRRSQRNLQDLDDAEVMRGAWS